jgi:hypothetical protein
LGALRDIGKKFQSDEAAKFGIFGFVNNAHAAAAQLFEDAVMRNGLPTAGVGICHLAHILGLL